MIAHAAAVAAAAWALAGTPAAAAPTAAVASTPTSGQPHRTAVRVAALGARPAGSPAERRLHRYAARRMRRAGLEVISPGFALPRGGRSRNVVGMLDTPARCLDVAMAHGDSAQAGRGALDNASGVGVVLALADVLAGRRTRCDVWLVVTGAEERIVTGSPDHLGSVALVRRVRRHGRADDLRIALSLDEVGRGRRFTLRSNAPRPRRRVEGLVIAAGRRAGVPVAWSRDSASGNSDHREFQLAGLPAAVMQVWQGVHPCRHTSCDQPSQLRRGAAGRALRVAVELLTRPRGGRRSG